MTHRITLLLAALAACAPNGAGPTPTTSSTSTGSADTDPGPTSTGTTDACMGSADCETDGICVAGYTPSADPENPGSRGPAGCVFVDDCIDSLDQTRFCFDHQGCCESLRCRTVDGVCEPPGLGQTTGTTTGETTGTTEGDTTEGTGTSSSTTDDTTGTTDG